jgi:HEAT repeat protein
MMPFIRSTAAAAIARDLDLVHELDRARAQVEHDDPVLRRAAARALTGVPGSTIVLLQALAGETEREVQSALLAALAMDTSAPAVAGLAECLRSEDAWLRNAAIDLLRAVPERSAPVVQALLGDDDRDVRILAIGILDALDPARAEGWLLDLLACETDVNVCGAALEVLAQVGTPASKDAVARLAARFAAEPFIGFACTLVQRRIGA